MAIDWLKIRNDYINGVGSYRELAEKYNVSQSTLRKKAAAEKWSEAKEKQLNKISSKLEQKSAEKIAEKAADRVARVLTLADQLADRIERAILELDQTQITHKKKTRTLEYKDRTAVGKPTKETVREEEKILAVASIVDRKGLQQVAASLKAIWDILNADAKTPEEDPEDDGLINALGKVAEQLFQDGDDSGMLPEEDE